MSISTTGKPTHHQVVKSLFDAIRSGNHMMGNIILSKGKKEVSQDEEEQRIPQKNDTLEPGTQIYASRYATQFLCIHLVLNRLFQVVDSRPLKVLTYKLCCIQTG